MDWRTELSTQERMKYVTVMLQSLKELALATSNPAATDLGKLKHSAEEFEKYCFQNANNKNTYLGYLKQKIVGIKTNTQQQMKIRQSQTAQQPQQAQQGIGMNIGGVNQSTALNPQQIQQQAQHQQMPLQQQQQRTAANTNQLFLAQQAQARQQAAQQLRSTQQGPAITGSMGTNFNQLGRQPQQNQNLTQQNLPSSQATGQVGGIKQPQQGLPNNELSNIMKTLPIPAALLAKLPGIPPNVNTWQQIFSLITSQEMSQEHLPIIRQAYSVHMQLVQKQQAQQKQFRQQQQQQQQQQAANGPVGANGQTNNVSNTATNDLNSQLNRHQQDIRSRQLQQNPQSQQVQQQVPGQSLPQKVGAPANQFQQQQRQQMGQQIPQQSPQLQQSLPMNAQFSQQDIHRLTQSALHFLSKLQQEKQVPTNLTDEQRSTFVKRYIQRQQQQAQQQIQQQQQQQFKIDPNQKKPDSSMLNSVQVQTQGVGATQNLNNQVAQPNWNTGNGNTNANNLGMSGMNQMDNTAQTQQARRQAVLQEQRAQQAKFAQQQAQNRLPQQGQVPQRTQQQQLSQQQQLPQQPPQQPPRQQMPNSGTSNQARNFIVPSERDSMELRIILNEVSKVPVKLANLTDQLNAEQKEYVHSKIQTLLIPLFNMIEQLVPTFYTLTKNVEGTKKLLHMRFMVKEVIDGLKKNEYYASPDLLEKVKAQSQKYVEFIKDQLRRKNAQNPAQAQQAHSAMSSQPQQTNSQMAGTQWGNNAGNSAQNGGINPQITPQQLLQRKQQQMNSQLTPQQLMQQQQQQQLNYQPGNLPQTSATDLNMGVGDGFNNIDMSLLNSRIATPEISNISRFNSSPAMGGSASFGPTANFNNSPQMGNMGLYNQQGSQMGNGQTLPGTFTNQLPQSQMQPQSMSSQKGRTQKVQPALTPAPTAPTPSSAGSSAPVTKKVAAPRRKSKAAAPKKSTSNTSTPNVAPKTVPTPGTTASTLSSDSGVNNVHAQLAKKEQDLANKEELASKQFDELKAKRLELFVSRPVDYFAASLANLLELNDEEAKLMNDNGKQKFSGDSKNSPFPKTTTLTPSAVLQTPLTFSSAKTPASSSKFTTASTMPGNAMYLSSPKLSPNSKTEITKWTPKVTREAIASAFQGVPEIQKLSLEDSNDVDVIPTPPPDTESKKRGPEEDLTQNVAAFKSIRLTDDNRFFNENDEELPNDDMWDYDFVSSHLVAE